MFQYFLQACKTQVYDKRRKNNFMRISKMQLFNAVIYCVLAILEVVFWVNRCNKYVVITVCIMFVEEVITILWRDNEWKKRNDELRKLYEVEVIHGIIKIMKSDNWKIYNRAGIQWSIDMCDDEIKETPNLWTFFNPIKNYTYFIILPVITAIGAAAIGKMSTQIIVIACVSFLIISIFLLGVGYIVFPILEMLFNSRQDFLLRFKKDLMYIFAKY